MADIANLVIALLNGVANGMLLFLAAVGLTLIFGVLGVLNFAHGSLYMLGAYFTYFLLDPTGELGFLNGQFWVVVILAAILVALIGGFIERFIIRFVYDHDHSFQLILTFALVLVLDNAARIFWGTSFRSLSVPDSLAFQMDLIWFSYPAYRLFLIILGTGIGVWMWAVFKYTRIGKAIRAAAEDRGISNALGINVPRLFTLTFIFGSALAGLAGALAAPYQSISPAMGQGIIIDAFIVVVLGGLGSFSGAFVGAMLIGIVQAMSFQINPALEPIIPFALMAGILLIRPTGIFGKEVSHD